MRVCVCVGPELTRTGSPVAPPDALATLQRDWNAKNDASMMLAGQVEKLKQQRAEEEAQRRAAVAEAQRLQSELASVQRNDSHAGKEASALKDAVASLQAALDKEKAAKHALAHDVARAEEAAAASLKKAASEHEVREAKMKRELQEAAEHVLRLRAEAKTAEKTHTEAMRALQTEARGTAEKLDAALSDAKKLRQRLDASQSYIDAMKHKQPAASGTPHKDAAPQCFGLDESASAAELQATVKSLQFANGTLQSALDAQRAKEAAHTAELSQLRKREVDLSNQVVKLEMAVDVTRRECNDAQLLAEQLKQAQRATEARAKTALEALDEYKAARSASADMATTAENSAAVELKRVQRELEATTLMHQAALKKAGEELREAREERDGALDMMASLQLEAEASGDAAARTLRNENAALRQSAEALEKRVALLTKQVRELEARLQDTASASASAAASVAPASASDEKAAAALMEANTRLKAELKQARLAMVNEVESVTLLLEEEMSSHQTAQEQLREARSRLALQEQSVAQLKARLAELSVSTEELSRGAAGASQQVHQQLDTLTRELATQRQQCDAMRATLDAKDAKIESMRLRVEELERTERHALSRHEEVRARLDECIAKEREAQRSVTTLQESKRKLEERLAEHQLESSAALSATAGAQRTAQETAQSLEAALKDAQQQLERETAKSAALHKRVGVLETELAQARDALLRAEASARATHDDLKQQLAAETHRLTLLRDEAIAEAQKQARTLSDDVAALREQLLKSQASAHSATAALTEQNSALASQLARALERAADSEAEAAQANHKRVQAEAAAAAAAERAQRAHVEMERERDALAQALSEVDMCRTMVAEAEVAADAAQAKLAAAQRDARQELTGELMRLRGELDEWTAKARDAEARASAAQRELDASTEEWVRERELLRGALSSTDAKSIEAQRGAEDRLAEANHALLEARGRLADVEGKHADAVARAASLEARLNSAQDESSRKLMNMQIQVDDLEDQLNEAQQEHERALDALRTRAEADLHEAREQVRHAERDAADARHAAHTEVAHVAQSEARAKSELGELEMRLEQLRGELASKSDALDALHAEHVRGAQEADSLRTELAALRVSHADACAELLRREQALETAEREVERARTALAAEQSQHGAQHLTLAAEASSLRDELAVVRHQAASNAHDHAQAERALLTRVAETDAQLAALTKRFADCERQLAGAQQRAEQLADQRREIEERLQSASGDSAQLARELRAASEAAARKQAEADKEAACAAAALESSQAASRALEQQLEVARGDLAATQERCAMHLRDLKEKDNELTMLLDQLAASEMQREDHEVTLARVRGERNDARVARDELHAKLTALEAESQRLAGALSSTEATKEAARVSLEERAAALQSALAREKEAATASAAQVRKLEAAVAQLEARDAALVRDVDKARAGLQRECDTARDELQRARMALDEMAARVAADKDAWTAELREAQRRAQDKEGGLKARDARTAALEAELGEARVALADATEQVRVLRSVQQKLTTAEAKLERQRVQWEAETAAQRERIATLEADAQSAQGTGVEWKHRAERVEHEAEVAKKERDRARDEARELRERLVVADKATADRAADVVLAQSALDDEKAAHARTSRGIVDQQKLIAAHLERNAKLATQVEEQRERMAKQEARLAELERAGTDAMTVLAYERDIKQLQSELEGQRALLRQKSSEQKKLNDMLLDYEEKLRGGGGGGELRAERDRLQAEAEERDRKYSDLLVVNRSLEKKVRSLHANVFFPRLTLAQVGSLERKCDFLKKKVAKFEGAEVE